MQLAQSALPMPHLGGKFPVGREQLLRRRAFIGVEGPEHVLARKRVLVAGD